MAAGRPTNSERSLDDAVAVNAAGTLGWRTMASELRASSDLLHAFAMRSLRASYKQTFFGIGWAVFRPLVMLGVFVFFFGNVAGFDEDTASYPAFAFSALVGWQLVGAVVGGSTYALIEEAALVRKVYFPRLAPILGRAAASVVQMSVGVAMLLVLGVVLDATYSVQLLWIPVLLGLLAVPALAVGVALGALSVWFRDFATLSGFLLQIWLFASPVAYPATKLDDLRLYSLLNPVVGPLDGLRAVYVDGQAPSGDLLLLSGATSLVLVAAALWIFRRLEPGFADVV